MEITEALRKIDIFSGLDDEIVNELAARVIRRQFAKDEVVVRQGEVGDGLYILIRGCVKVEHTDANSSFRLAQLGPEQFFGEMSLLDGKPRPATITALEETECLVLTRERFLSLAMKYLHARAALPRYGRVRPPAAAALPDLPFPSTDVRAGRSSRDFSEEPPPPTPSKGVPSFAAGPAAAEFTRMFERVPPSATAAQPAPPPAPVAAPAPGEFRMFGYAISPVRFSVYHPRAIAPVIWHTLIAYAHIPDALDTVNKDLEARLGRAKAKPYGKGSASATQTIQRGAEIVVVPDLPGCACNPPRISFLWLEDWHCAEFRVRTISEAPASHAAMHGKVSFYVGPILVAEVRVDAVFSSEDRQITSPAAVLSVEPYQAVFVSYSHEDFKIVRELEKAYTALGLEYLRDVRKLRSGEQWDAALLDMIENADIFQLCWSSAARASPYVEREWRHALSKGRPGFIRPTYWEEPMPPPPPELASIHFAHLEIGWRSLRLRWKAFWGSL